MGCESEYLSDVDPYLYAEDLVSEERDLLGRVHPTNDIYIIQATSPYDHSTIYLQDKRIRGYGGKWTLYRNNARWFNSKEEAVKVCKQFRYNNAKVVKVRDKTN